MERKFKAHRPLSSANSAALPAVPPAGTADVKPSGTAEPAAPDKRVTDKRATDQPEKQQPDPTRFGDWSIGGRCIDF